MDKPFTRKEQYLDAIARLASNASLPEPITREERYLKAIFDAVTSGGGGGGESLQPFYVELSGTYLGRDKIDNISCDRNVSEIFEALDSGKNIVFRTNLENVGTSDYLAVNSFGQDSSGIRFISTLFIVAPAALNLMSCVVTLYDNGNISNYMSTIW